jgi:ribosomal protein S18 acetylase RimI-like enzyme
MEVADTVRKATPDDLPQLSAALSKAFLDDPLMAWAIPDQDRRQRLLPEFFALFTRAFLRHHQTYTTAGDVVAAALWAPPGAVPVSGQDAQELGERIVELAGPDAPRFLGVNKLFDDHHPHGSYWYLQFLGVAPAWQGRGVGSALMAPVLARCDREGHGPTWTRPANATGGCTSATASRPRSRSPLPGGRPCGRCGASQPRSGSDT